MKQPNQPSNHLRIVMAQLNFWVGDIVGNTEKIIASIQRARTELHADLIVFPELALCGYLPDDLLFHHDFHQQIQSALVAITPHVQGIDAVISYPAYKDGHLFNAAVFIHEGKHCAHYQKQRLPNYGVFDEARYFTAGTKPCLVTVKNISIGIIICEDLWFPEAAAQTTAAGAQLLLSINASPFDVDKQQQREQLLHQRTQENALPILYIHGAGAQDELIFDGNSFAMDQHGQVCTQGAAFAEQLIPVDFQLTPHLQLHSSPLPIPLSKEARIYQALVLGLREYVEKNNFKQVILGLSGGIDSAVSLAIAVDALGSERVRAFMLPSRYTSELSLRLAREQTHLLDVAYSTISIEPIFETFLTQLAEEFSGKSLDITEENLQARCRGTLLMAISNKTGSLLLSCSNKSELAVGYGTLYGDMAGGFSLLKDVLKTTVFQLAAYRNTLSPAIPSEVITRAPSAELAANQKDEDSLPPYEVLDGILIRYIENNASIADIVAAGYAEEVVRRVVGLVKRNEYKRRQSPPGPKISRRSFGRDWRYPITLGVKK